jgi:hypothetical protein
LTKFELFEGDFTIDMLEKAKINDAHGMIYFVYFDGEKSLKSGHYFLRLET